ncbi:hypothetical protein HPB48_025124 [Haemaphysalis longicornis]|uniref:NOT2/NOT3/NOT5 C-terminal domain-containing protein n=1 Tax=Haemaphysalis longicornis TaxID=44386 RepID=A0A9J6H9G7_HAELO|nr:hypothetical protein HPB48_025124 [Haemaphysalis longicornis]
MPYAVAAAAASAVIPRCSSPPTAPSTDGATKFAGHLHRASLATQNQHSSASATNTANTAPQQPGKIGAAINPERRAPTPVADFCLPLSSSKDWPSLPTATTLARLNGPPVAKGGDSAPASNSMAQQSRLSSCLGNRTMPSSSQEQMIQKSLLPQSLHRIIWQPQHQPKRLPGQAEPFVERGMFGPIARPRKEVPRQEAAAAKEARTASSGAMPFVLTAPLSEECRSQLRFLEAASRHMPQPGDSERLRPSLQRRPVEVPSYYPQCLPQCNMGAFFTKLSAEALFFAFYNMEGSTGQYLAARALKKQSWRFHTKYMSWFRRQDDPKIITDEYEMGNYIYFDFETWSERRMENFTFEYRYLEERDLN